MQTKGSIPGLPPSARENAPCRRPQPLHVLCVVLVAVAVYLPALRNGFVWDDEALILRDPLIRSWRLAGEGFRHFLFTDATPSSFYRPVQRLTYIVDYALYGFSPRGYHFTNLVLHAGAAVGLLFLATACLGKGRGTLVAAIGWAVLPTHSSAVIYVAGRADLLAALFGFWGLWAATRGWRVAAAVLVLAATLSKEHGLVFALLLPLFGAVRGRWFERAGWAGIGVAVALAMAMLRMGASGPAPPAGSEERTTPRVVIAARALTEYAGLILSPVNLRMERDVVADCRTGESDKACFARQRWRELQGAVGAMLLVGFLFWFVKAGPEIRLLLASAVLSYLPVSGLFALNANVAEHWIYLPSAFLLPAVFAAVRTPWIATPWIVYCGVFTFVRCGDWKDQRTFLVRTVKSGGDSARMILNLGNLESNAGQLARALAIYGLARERDPDLAFIDLAEGSAFLRLDKPEAARTSYLRAGRDPFFRAEAMVGLAAVFNRTREGDPLALLETASRVSGRFWPIEKRRLQALAGAGERAKAVASMKDLLEKEWWRSEAWEMLAQWAEEGGDDETARRARAMAARMDVHLLSAS